MTAPKRPFLALVLLATVSVSLLPIPTFACEVVTFEGSNGARYTLTRPGPLYPPACGYYLDGPGFACEARRAVLRRTPRCSGPEISYSCLVQGDGDRATLHHFVFCTANRSWRYERAEYRGRDLLSLRTVPLRRVL